MGVFCHGGAQHPASFTVRAHTDPHVGAAHARAIVVNRKADSSNAALQQLPPHPSGEGDSLPSVDFIVAGAVVEYCRSHLIVFGGNLELLA